MSPSLSPPRMEVALKPASLWSIALFGLLLGGSMTVPDAGAQEALALCLAEAADYSPVYATQTFPAPTTGPVVVFRVPKGTYQKLTIRWIALDPGNPSGGGDIGLPGFADRSIRACTSRATQCKKSTVSIRLILSRYTGVAAPTFLRRSCRFSTRGCEPTLAGEQAWRS